MCFKQFRGGCGDSSECAVNNLGEGVGTVVNVL